MDTFIGKLIDFNRNAKYKKKKKKDLSIGLPNFHVIKIPNSHSEQKYKKIKKKM